VNQVRQASTEIRGALAEAHRRQWAFVLAATVRLAGDLDIAEECVQDAFVAALTSWTQRGIPANPGAWLTATARRRALDTLRRDQTLRRKLPLLVGTDPAASDPLEWEDIKVEDQVNLHPGGWAGRNRCGAGPSARPARWRVDGRSAAPVRLHLGLCPAGAAGRDDTATGARAIRINPAVGSVPRRARYGGQLRDDATDAPWDQRSVRRDQPLGRQGEALQASVEDPARPTPRSKRR
jgi:Sigma-70 region 2